MAYPLNQIRLKYNSNSLTAIILANSLRLSDSKEKRLKTVFLLLILLFLPLVSIATTTINPTPTLSELPTPTATVFQRKPLATPSANTPDTVIVISDSSDSDSPPQKRRGYCIKACDRCARLSSNALDSSRRLFQAGIHIGAESLDLARNRLTTLHSGSINLEPGDMLNVNIEYTVVVEKDILED